MSNSAHLSPEDFSAAIAEKDRARSLGEDHKVAKFWEPELDALHSSDSLADGGVATEAEKESAKRADEAFRGALGARMAELLTGCGFTRCRVSSYAESDDEGWRETKYVAEALDTEGRKWECTIERGARLHLVEHTREFLFDFADQIAARLVEARDAYLARMVDTRTAEVAQA